MDLGDGLRLIKTPLEVHHLVTLKVQFDFPNVFPFDVPLKTLKLFTMLIFSLDQFKTVEDAKKTAFNWFPQKEAEKKRYEISNVIKKLSKSTIIPSLNL